MIKRLLSSLFIGALLISSQAFADGIDSFNVTNLHCDGADTSTTFTDSSSSGHTMVAVGNAQIDTAQSKFGGASGLFDGTGDWLTTIISSDYAFGTGDFTIDLWVRFAASPSGEQGLVGLDSTTSGIDFFGNDTTTIRVWLVGSANNFTVSSMSSATQYHIAISRSGSSVRVFLDGTESSSGAWTNSGDVTNTLGAVIGARVDTSSPLNGWLDEVRISKGVARWTANFTPPTAAYSAPGVKTYNGLAVASVKTVDGLAIASVKSRNGLQ